MKALVDKDKLMKKQEKEMRKAPHFFMYIYLFYFVENGSKKLIFR